MWEGKLGHNLLICQIKWQLLKYTSVDSSKIIKNTAKQIDKVNNNMVRAHTHTHKKRILFSYDGLNEMAPIGSYI